jgi:NAD(P)-dependent dehydrogenase (short-subunit alcohol dehydrogenase family)
VILRGRVAVVTGGAAGLGRFIARALALRGMRVVIGDRDEDAGEACVAALAAAGGSAVFVDVDVTDDRQLALLVEVATRQGPLGALVNNAGGVGSGPSRYPDSSPATWSRVLDLNLRAPMLTTQLVLEPMSANGGGAIVNVASSAGIGPDAHSAPEYSAAKAGLIRLTSSLSDLGSLGIRVACVVPHWIGLPRAQQEFAGLSREERQNAGGLVDPETIADEVVRLIEDDESAGRIVAMRPEGAPYLLDPARVDPRWP